MNRPLERELWVTTFRDVAATTKQSRFQSLRALRQRLLDTTAPTKAALPLLKLASFGERRTPQRSLRHNRNVHEVYGLEADYDGERLTPEDLAEALRRHNLAGLVVTSPSHRDEAPRARLFLPFSTPLKPAEREVMIGRLAGIIPAPHQLAPESWTLSQAYYFGRVGEAPQHRVVEVEGDYIDLRPDLDATAGTKPPPASRQKTARKRPVSRAASNGAQPSETGEGTTENLSVADALFALGDDAPGIHDALVALCGKLAAEGMTQVTAEAVILNAFDRRPEAARDARWQARRVEVKRTIAWAYEREAAGSAQYAQLLLSARQAPAAGAGGGCSAAAPPVAPGAQPQSGPQPPDLDLDASQPPPYTDEAMALVFAATHTDRLRFVQAWGKWFVWDGRTWQQDDTLRSFSLTRLLLRQASATAPKRRIAAALADSRTVAAVERLARADRRLAATTEQWDADAHLLNTPAGVVDLTTGAVLPHDPARHMTKITALAPGGDCPRWLGFLKRITGGDDALQAYLQRASGYCLSGSTREHKLFFGYGTGANGKSVFLTTLRSVLGSYAAVAAMETFTATQNEQHPCDLAMLRGARLVVATETEGGKRWAESRIKLMTGGDAISARFMRQDFFTYTPAFKLFIAGNHRPGLRSVDQAMRRRLDLVPFAVTIPEAERDRRLTARLRSEWPGILAWAVEGCLAWQRDGLAPPPAVTAATEEYLAGEDVVQNWIEDCCTIAKGKAAYSIALYSSFKAWAELTGEFVPAQRWLTAALADRGYRQGRAKSGQGRDLRIIIGLALKSGAGAATP